MSSFGCSSEVAQNLAREIVSGSSRAESELVSNYYRPLLSRVERKVSNVAAAEDICQECFIAALRMLRRNAVREPGKLGALLIGIAERQVSVYVRANRLGTELTGVDLEPFEDCRAEMGQPLPREEVDGVRQAVDMLGSPRDRELLIRRYWLGQTAEEIQQDLGLTPIVFKKAISRARSRVRKILEPESGRSPRKASRGAWPKRQPSSFQEIRLVDLGV